MPDEWIGRRIFQRADAATGKVEPKSSAGGALHLPPVVIPQEVLGRAGCSINVATYEVS